MPKTNVFINGSDYSELVSDLTTSIEFEKNYLVGNAPSQELTMKVINVNGEFNELLDSPFILQREDGTKLGTFYVVKKPERMTKELSLTLYDSMYKANVEYVSVLEYPTTIRNILIDISSILGIKIDYSLMPKYALNRVVNSYDSREMIRSHLCWIAELGACNVFANEDGNYVFKPLSKAKTHDLPPDDVEQFETIEDYCISGVMFTNGIVTIFSGNEEHNIYRIDENNLYIDSQDDLDNIYTHLNGLSFRSSNALKCANIESLQLGEIVNVADEFNIMPLSIKQTYLNATYDIHEISGEVSTKNEEKVSDSSSIVRRIRRVQGSLDQTNNKISLLAEDVEDNKEKIGELILSNEQFEVTITEKVTKIENKVTVIDITPEYGKSDSSDTEPTEWFLKKPNVSETEYLWMREIYTYSDGKTKTNKARVVSAKDGIDGKDGSSIWTTTTAPTTPNYTFTISKLTGGNGTPIKVGDIIKYSYYMYTVTSISSTTVLASTRVSIRGATGSKGETGDDGTVKSATPPDDTDKMWLDTSVEPNILKYFDGTSWIRANDHSQDIQDTADQLNKNIEETKISITTEYSSALQTVKDEIDLRVSSVETIVGEAGEKITGLETQLAVTDSMVQITKTTTETLQSAIDGKVSQEELEEYVRFDGARIEIGKSDSLFKTVITNEELAFYQGDVKVAWISNNELHVTNAIITTGIRVGKFSFVDEGDLGFSLIMN